MNHTKVAGMMLYIERENVYRQTEPTPYPKLPRFHLKNWAVQFFPKIRKSLDLDQACLSKWVPAFKRARDWE